MSQLLLGLVILAAWAAVVYGLQPASGWIHLLLIGGVILVIRGIVLRDPGDPDNPASPPPG